MSMLNVTLPDGTIKEVPKGTTPLDVARSIGEGLARQTVAAYFGETLVDASLSRRWQHSPRAVSMPRERPVTVSVNILRKLPPGLSTSLTP